MKFVALLLAALLAMAAAQSLSPTPSGSPLISSSPASSPLTSGSPAASPSSSAAAGGLAQFSNCNTLLLNGTGNFDIVLLGSAAPSASGSPSASSSPAASGSPAASISGSPAASSAASRSPAVSTSGSPAASPSLANASPSLSISPSASVAASSSPASSAAASASPAISPSANTRLLQIANSLLGGRIAVNGNALITNSIVGGALGCVSASPSGSPALSSSPAASGSPASSISGSPAASTSGSPAASTAAVSGSPSAALSRSPAASSAAVSGSPLATASGSPSASISGSPAASRSPSASASPAASSAADISLLVNGNLAVSNAQIACGGLAVGGQLTGTPTFGQQNAPNLSGSAGLSRGNVDFATLRTQLLATSNELCSLPATGRFSLNNGAAVFDASASGSNSTSSSLNSTSASVTLFNFPSSDLANLTSVLINGTQTNGFVIINVVDQAASSASSSAARNLTLSSFGTDAGSLNATHLLWNFCNASNIEIDNILLLGTILAPRSTVNILRAELEGGLIAESLTGNFFNQVPLRFAGNFCPAAASSSPSPSPSTSASPAASASPATSSSPAASASAAASPSGV